MKCNYPVKYASMPIIEQIGWDVGLNELERSYGVVCYIVSKCYVLSDKTKYKENGKSVKEYEVVFPYQNEKHYSWKRVMPEFNLINYTCTNSNLVDKVFDNYEEALEFTTEKNKKICDETLSYLPYTENSTEQASKKIEEFNDKLSKYKMLEQQILINTSDLDQANVKELKKVIRSSKGKMEILSRNLYEYLKFSSVSDFIVYSVSQKQYDNLIALDDNQDPYEISKIIGNINPLLYNDSNNQNIMVINNTRNILYYIDEWENLDSSNEQKISSIELSSIPDEIECLFTTETFEDIILSFKEHKHIELDKIQGPILKKTLFDKNRK